MSVNFKKQVLSWVQKWVKRYGIPCTNLSRDYKDGLLFLAIVHRFTPKSFDFKQIKAQNNPPEVNLKLAFDTAEKELDISKLLDVEDITDDEVPDPVIICTYLSMFIKYHKNFYMTMNFPSLNTKKDKRMSFNTIKRGYENRVKVKKEKKKIPLKKKENILIDKKTHRFSKNIRFFSEKEQPKRSALSRVKEMPKRSFNSFQQVQTELKELEKKKAQKKIQKKSKPLEKHEEPQAVKVTKLLARPKTSIKVTNSKVLIKRSKRIPKKRSTGLRKSKSYGIVGKISTSKSSGKLKRRPKRKNNNKRTKKDTVMTGSKNNLPKKKKKKKKNVKNLQVMGKSKRNINYNNINDEKIKRKPKPRKMLRSYSEIKMKRRNVKKKNILRKSPSKSKLNLNQMKIKGKSSSKIQKGNVGVINTINYRKKKIPKKKKKKSQGLMSSSSSSTSNLHTFKHTSSKSLLNPSKNHSKIRTVSININNDVDNKLIKILQRYKNNEGKMKITDMSLYWKLHEKRNWNSKKNGTLTKYVKGSEIFKFWKVKAGRHMCSVMEK